MGVRYGQCRVEHNIAVLKRIGQRDRVGVNRPYYISSGTLVLARCIVQSPRTNRVRCLLDQDKKSHAGAVSVMQVIPKLAAANPIGISNVDDADGNIHAGVKMMRNIADTYFNDPTIDPVGRKPIHMELVGVELQRQ